MLEVVEYLPDHYRILGAGNDFHWATTRLARLDADVKHPAVSSGQFTPSLGLTRLFRAQVRTGNNSLDRFT